MDRKILFVNSKYGFFGGVERYVYDTAGLLKRNGWKCYGVFEEATDNTEGFGEPFESVRVGDISAAALGEIKGHNVNVAFVHKVSDPALFEGLYKYFKVATFIHDHDYYCIRRHKYFPITRKNCPLPYNLLVCGACSGLIRREESSPIKVSPVKIRDYIKLLAAVKLSDMCFVMSEFMRHNLVMNGFDQLKTAKLYPVKYPVEQVTDVPQSNNLLYVGQIIRGKGVDLLLEAMTKVKSDCRLRIIGKGNDEGYVRSLISRYGLESRVEMLGWCGDVGRHYEQSNVVVVPSRWQEPFGMIGVEAYSYGRPVVGFDVGGISEWLKDIKTGFLVPPRDTDKMAQRIDAFLEDTRIQNEYGQNGYKMVKKYYGQEVFLEKFSSMIGKLDV